MIITRGRVYWAQIGDQGEKPYLCVSNNTRNGRLDDFLAVRITTSRKPQLTSIVLLTSADHPLVGSVLCDDVLSIFRDEVRRDGGAVSLNTMLAVQIGLKAALGLL